MGRGAWQAALRRITEESVTTEQLDNSSLLQGTHQGSVQFSPSVLSDSLWPHGLQHARLPCPSPTPGAYSNSCPSSQCAWDISWDISQLMQSDAIQPPYRPLLLLPSVFPNIRVFSNDSVLHIRWPKYWSFSFSVSPSNEYSGLISFRMDWLDLLTVQGDSQESSPTPQFKSINSSTLSFLYSPTLTPIHDYWKNHCFDRCWQSNVSAF